LGRPQLARRLCVSQIEVHGQSVLLCDLLDAVVQVGNDEEGVHDLIGARGRQPVGCFVPDSLSHLGLVSLLVESRDGFGLLIRQSGTVE
jgi:hypothetical protein